jgi:gliding motility-associated lipoprotein GldD
MNSGDLMLNRHYAIFERLTMRLIPIYVLTGFLFFSESCKKEYTPRPRGYFRISFPAKSYKPLDLSVPYFFQVPIYSTPGHDLLSPDQPNWITIEVPANHAQIHLSYKKINNNLEKYIEESRSLAYQHSQKASAIEERLFINPSKKVYGTIYNIKGNAASPMQFYLTDSTRNFLRGSLYIKEIPNSDSLQPVIGFLIQDVLHLIKTTEWKEVK